MSPNMALASSGHPLLIGGTAYCFFDELPNRVNGRDSATHFADDLFSRIAPVHYTDQ
jgi:hypothetical protein